MRSAPSALAESDALELLTHGSIEVQGRMATASNATLYARVDWQGISGECIYKPVAGERPLWDFPPGTLGKREVAAYHVSVASGWDLVPPTVWRAGPFGPGSVQLWVPALPDNGLIDVVAPAEVPPGWLSVLQAEGRRGEPVLLVHADDVRLARLAVLDAVIDNADRKAGHVLRTAQDRVWGVDHGVSFNVEPKLRTVLWGFGGAPLPAEATGVLRALSRELAGEAQGALAPALAQLLSPPEVSRTRERVDELLTSGAFPLPAGHGPVIPWPPW